MSEATVQQLANESYEKHKYEERNEGAKYPYINGFINGYKQRSPMELTTEEKEVLNNIQFPIVNIFNLSPEDRHTLTNTDFIVKLLNHTFSEKVNP